MNSRNMKINVQVQNSEGHDMFVQNQILQFAFEHYF